MKTSHQTIVDALAARGRRYSIRVIYGGSVVIDSGVCNGRRARDTEFIFDTEGRFMSTNRWLKAAWLARGTGVNGW